MNYDDKVAAVRTFQHWAPSALALYLTMIDQEIAMKQALREAAAEALQLQGKRSEP